MIMNTSAITVRKASTFFNLYACMCVVKLCTYQSFYSGQSHYSRWQVEARDEGSGLRLKIRFIN